MSSNSSSNKKTITTKQKESKDGERLFFDPKRIFTPLSKSKINEQRKTELLNNGKPKQSHIKCGIEKSNTSSFINNDLGHDWEHTHCDGSRHMMDRNNTYVKSEFTSYTKANNLNEAKINRATERKTLLSRKFDRRRGHIYATEVNKKIKKAKADHFQVMLGEHVGIFQIYVAFPFNCDCQVCDIDMLKYDILYL